ncbi:MAG: type I DNA topoisomerase [Xanthomonadales bacterium]|jgi:DNA topoisomerase-1|nr:type I DNA topoisomerase [Xanthomonadales bacterium]
MSKNLLIVESPAKIKSISKVLGKDFTILASFGHVRDLPSKDGSVDVDHDFAMRYEVIDRNQKHVAAIAKAMKEADTLWLATDLDREGEAISWHLYEILREKKLLKDKTVNRVVFPEITPRAIRDAIAKPRPLSLDLVNAQQARRALDYLVGFNLSPLLWRKVQRGLSAGRVQSPALRMIVEREEEIEAFVAQEYWTLTADCLASAPFAGKLVEYQGKKLGQFDLNTEALATAAKRALEQAAGGTLTVSDVRRKDRQRRAAPPFITSTLQQEASRKLGFGTQRTMRLAQDLYEGVAIHGGEVVGLITYMRTDSVNLSRDAIGELRDAIVREYGQDYLPESPNFYQTKSKSAQEAHEAIRPTSALRTPAAMKAFLDADHLKLYELIWKRTIASQMKPALLNTVSVDLMAGTAGMFRATGTTVVFPGFLAVYEEGRDQRSEEDEEGGKLPPLAIGDRVQLKAIKAEQHFTEPPPRYSEASLVKALEEHGIGRPSTYASIIQVLLAREYVRLESRRFYPSDIGRAVAKFLSGHFAQYVDYGFTAKLEDELDSVANGEEQWQPLLRRFWSPFIRLVKEKDESVTWRDTKNVREVGIDPASGLKVIAQLGRYGPYVQIGEQVEGSELKPRRASLKQNQSVSTITLEEALKLFQLPRVLGNDAQGRELKVNIGRFGPYVQADKLFASLAKGDDPYTLTLGRAIQLVEAKEASNIARTLKEFDGGRIKVMKGRFGPYVTDGVKMGRLPKGVDGASVDEATALAALAAAPEPKGRKAAAKKAPAKSAKAKTAPVAEGGEALAKPARKAPARSKASPGEAGEAAAKPTRKTPVRRSAAESESAPAPRAGRPRKAA